MAVDPKIDPNPYSPPSAPVESADAGRLPLTNLILEILQAFATILGIMVGWVVVGAGLVQSNPFVLSVGCTVIVLSSVLGLRTGQRGKQSKKRRSKRRTA